MAIVFECSGCNATLRARSQHVGRKTRCPACDAQNRIPKENASEDVDIDLDDEIEAEKPTSRRASSKTSSRTERSSSLNSKASPKVKNADRNESPKRKKKKSKGTSKPPQGGGVPAWAIVVGASIGGLFMIGAIGFAVRNMMTSTVANTQAAAKTKSAYVPVETGSHRAKFKMKWEMPFGWTEESSIEDGLWPWAQASGQGLTVRIVSNKSLSEMSSTMTSIGGFEETLKTAHTVRLEKLRNEYTDFEDGPLNVHQGPNGPIVWSHYEFKGILGKGYGIRCTVSGPRMPCTVTMECAKAMRDKKQEMVFHIAGSIRFVRLNSKGEEEEDPFDRPAPRRKAPQDANQPAANEMNSDSGTNEGADEPVDVNDGN